jgi:hypothetical protein
MLPARSQATAGGSIQQINRHRSKTAYPRICHSVPRIHRETLFEMPGPEGRSNEEDGS